MRFFWRVVCLDGWLKGFQEYMLIPLMNKKQDLPLLGKNIFIII